MSLFVQMFVVISLIHTMTFWRYHRNRSIRLDNGDKSVRIVPLVSNHIFTVISDYQPFRLSYVMSLTGGQMNS